MERASTIYLYISTDCTFIACEYVGMYIRIIGLDLDSRRMHESVRLHLVKYNTMEISIEVSPVWKIKQNKLITLQGDASTLSQNSELISPTLERRKNKTH
jgi:hypothetical protein